MHCVVLHMVMYGTKDSVMDERAQDLHIAGQQDTFMLNYSGQYCTKKLPLKVEDGGDPRED